MTSASNSANRADSSAGKWSRPAVALAILVTLGVMGVGSRVALLIWILDGAIALSIFFCGMLAGIAILDVFGFRSLRLHERLIWGAGLGVGFLSLLTLALGLCGLVGANHRAIAPAILLVCAAVGAWRLLQAAKQPHTDDRSRGFNAWVLPSIAVFVGLIMLVAVNPPGLLWAEEGGGYDVLEYHLQLPKEYYENGAIDYLPHNVYANMPSAAEMLYLFCNLITGHPIEGWPAAKCLNALLALALIAAGGLAARQMNPRATNYGALLTASTGWLVYLSGVAYVENGLMLTGMLAMAALLRGAREDDERGRGRWTLLAGVLAGLSCGFKYTGLVMVLAPLAVAALIVARVGWPRRIKHAVLFAAVAMVTVSPWLIKNLVLTGNPVFPLANQAFGAFPPGFGPEQSARFDAGHQPSARDASISGRFRLLWRHVLGDRDQRFGPIIFALAAVALMVGRNRLTAALAVVMLVQLGVWMFATHLYARFAVPLIIPLIPLAAAAMTLSFARILIPLLLAGVAFNLAMTYRLYDEHVPRTTDGQRFSLEGAVDIFIEGKMPGFEYIGSMNANVPRDGRVLLVGDARPFYSKVSVDYCVVFNQDRFVEMVETCSSLDEVMVWLRAKGYTHILVHWAEIARLKTTYGFSEWITITLFDQLEAQGLELIEFIRYGNTDSPYAVLYRVTPAILSDESNHSK